MGLRKASAYSKRRVRPFTRKSSVRRKAYIKAVPPNKIVKFNMGNQRDFVKGKHKFIVRLMSDESVQIRDNSLESCRLLINKSLDRQIPGNYFFIVKVFPHHILRENKTAAGAGADRLSSGMKHSFGVTIGRAALLHKGKELFFVSTLDEKSARVARKTLLGVKSKIPCKSRVLFEEVK